MFYIQPVCIEILCRVVWLFAVRHKIGEPGGVGILMYGLAHSMWPEPCNDRPWTPANYRCRISVCSIREFEPAVIPATLIVLSHYSVNIKSPCCEYTVYERNIRASDIVR